MHPSRRAFLTTSLLLASSSADSSGHPASGSSPPLSLRPAPLTRISANLANLPSRSTAALTQIPQDIHFAEVDGFDAAGDGGQSLYARARAEPAHAGKFRSRDGAWFELAEDEVALEMFASPASLASDAGPAIVLAAALNRPIKGRPGATYTVRTAANLSLVNGLDFDGRGARLRVLGKVQGLARYAAPTSSRRVIGSATVGSNSVRVAFLAGLAVGHDVQIFAENVPATAQGAYPYHWARIIGLSEGGVVTFDSALPVTYAGVITLRNWSTTVKNAIRLVNMTLDGTACTYTDSGSALWFAGYRRVDLDIHLEGFTGGSPVVVTDCVEADLRVKARGYDLRQAGVINVQQCRTVRVIGADLAGSGFGITLTRCSLATASGNILRGRLADERASRSSSRSVRGIKMTGNGRAIVTCNKVSGFESLVKIQAAHDFEVTDNTLRDAVGDQTAIALNVSSIVANGQSGNPSGRTGLITRNSVERCSGAGIGVDNEATLKVTISDNTVRSTGAHGIYANLPDAVVTGNQISDWDLTNRGHVGLHFGSGATVRGNRFSHANQSKPCLRSLREQERGVSVGGNVSEAKNSLSG